MFLLLCYFTFLVKRRIELAPLWLNMFLLFFLFKLFNFFDRKGRIE